MAERQHPRQDPARRPLPLAAWPAADRAAWMAALAPGDVLEPGGAAARWRAHSRRNVEGGWGHFLAWLARDGRLDEGVGPQARATPERMAAYVTALRARDNAPQTVLLRLEHLDRFLGAVAPGCDRRWLKRLLACLRTTAGSGRDKRARLQSAHELFALGLRLMTLAEVEERTSLHRAAVYRDGLMIALLAARPLRRRNFAALELGRHLQRDGGGWRLVISGAETKTGRLLDLPFPEILAPALERYLTVYRPVLMARRGRWYRPAGEALWLSAHGSPLSEVALYFRLMEHTQAAFGRVVNPHLFRDAAATSIALEDPARVRIAAQVLGHAAFATTERHYNLARSQDAASAWHQVLDGLRQAK
jgi:integrase/recombinase XerD